MHKILGGYGVEFFCINGFPKPEQTVRGSDAR
jgi:hypothetical protein